MIFCKVKPNCVINGVLVVTSAYLQPRQQAVDVEPVSARERTLQFSVLKLLQTNGTGSVLSFANLTLLQLLNKLTETIHGQRRSKHNVQWTFTSIRHSQKETKFRIRNELNSNFTLFFVPRQCSFEAFISFLYTK